jgi:hypothetical protein
VKPQPATRKQHATLPALLVSVMKLLHLGKSFTSILSTPLSGLWHKPSIGQRQSQALCRDSVSPAPQASEKMNTDKKKKKKKKTASLSASSLSVLA